ncbi:MAG: hypothetical protein HC903_07745 [Methylacidiphilales bacterium]|nr:hypothetical protein [Candidatus Methylacidiphilales bacterium]NJR16394.1 hypothetical protein [Calothrix sp. CSU_2_0]
MTSTFVAVPKFRHHQMVHFIGGEGVIKSFQSEADTWIYKIEMVMNPDVDIPRIGYETTVFILESEIELLMID